MSKQVPLSVLEGFGASQCVALRAKDIVKVRAASIYQQVRVQVHHWEENDQWGEDLCCLVKREFSEVRQPV